MNPNLPGDLAHATGTFVLSNERSYAIILGGGCTASCWPMDELGNLLRLIRSARGAMRIFVPSCFLQRRRRRRKRKDDRTLKGFPRGKSVESDECFGSQCFYVALKSDKKIGRCLPMYYIANLLYLLIF